MTDTIVTRYNLLDAAHAADKLEHAALRALDDLGLDVAVRTDFTTLKDLISKVMPVRFNPTFDPESRDLHPDSYWLHVTTRSGALVGTIATTTIQGDLPDIIATGRLWHDRHALPTNWWRRAPLLPLSRDVSGTLSHDGAGWVAPPWRDKRVAFHMQSILRAGFLRATKIDFVTAVCFSDVAERSIPVKCYGYPTHGIELIIDGFLPGPDADVRLFALHMSRTEALRQAASRHRAVLPAASAYALSSAKSP